MDNKIYQENILKEIAEIKEILNKEHEGHHDYLKVMIERESQRNAFRRSVIEKTTASLIWSFLCFVGYAIWKYITTGGKV